MVSLNETASDPSYSGVYGDFKILNYGNDFDSNYQGNYLWPIFYQVKSKGFNVSSQIIKSAIYSINL